MREAPGERPFPAGRTRLGPAVRLAFKAGRAGRPLAVCTAAPGGRDPIKEELLAPGSPAADSLLTCHCGLSVFNGGSSD